MIDTLHESMDRSLQRLVDLSIEERPRLAKDLLGSIARDLVVERRLLVELDIRVPGLSGVDPLAALQQGEMDRLLGELETRDEPDERRWDATLAELRLQLGAAFVAVDLALSERR